MVARHTRRAEGFWVIPVQLLVGATDGFLDTLQSHG
jgi:hypothetical protein